MYETHVCRRLEIKLSGYNFLILASLIIAALPYF